MFVLLFGAFPAFSETSRVTPSATKEFIIDGRRFTVKKDFFPRSADELRDASGSGSSPALNLPHGFRSEHRMRFESDNGPVDLVFGDIPVHGPGSMESLSASGWQRIIRDHTPNGLSVAMKKCGKEVNIVFLEEGNRKFLLIRRME